MRKVKLWLSYVVLLLMIACGQALRPQLRSETPPLPPENQSELSPAAILAQSLATAGKTVVVTNGPLINGSDTAPIPNGVVVIRDERIVAAGQATGITIPAGAHIIDAGGRTILPGIINAHVHNSHTSGTRRRFLESGVTAACDLATSLADMPHFSQAYTDKGLPTAHGFHTGPMLTAPEGYPSQDGFRWDYQVATPIEARAAVLDLLDRGADMVKIALEPGHSEQSWPVLGLAEVKAIVETAHQYGLPVRAHVQRSELLDIALEAGVDTIEHVPLPFDEALKLRQMGADDRLTLASYPELEAQLTQMANQGVVLVSTLNVSTCATHNLPGLETEPRRQMCNFQLEIVGRFHELGGTVALGNDYGNLGVQRGMPLREMELLQAAGLSPMAIIEAGTRHAARVCGHGQALGTLEAGKLADLIVVDGDPLVEIEALGRIRLVIKGGEIAYVSDLEL